MSQIKVPARWTTRYLEDICEDIQPGFAQGKKDVRNGVIHLRMNNIGTNFEFNFDLVRTIDATPEQLKKYKLEKDDIIFNNTNSSKLVGKSAIFNNLETCLYSNHLTRIRVKKQIVVPKWLLFYLRMMWLSGSFERMCNKWINQAAVNNNKIKNLAIPLAPLDEQKKIVRKLDYILGQFKEKKKEILQEINKFNSQKTNQKYKKYIIKLAFDGTLTNEKPINSEMSQNHAEWQSKKLREVCKNISSGGTPSRSNSEYFGGDIRWLKIGDLNNNVVYDSEEKITKKGLESSSAKLLPKNTILIAMYGATIGKTAILGNECATNQAICSLQCSDLLEPDFLHYFLKSQYFKIRSMSEGGAQPNINQNKIKELEIPLAPLDEQKKIIQILDKNFSDLEHYDRLLKSIDDKHEIIKKQLDVLEKLILSTAFSGKLVN